MRALLIDRDLAILRLFCCTLQKRGYDVIGGRTFDEAKPLLSEHPDVIIMGLIPPPDAFDFLEFLQRERPSVLQRVLIVTAMPESVDELFEDVPVLHKPFELDAVLAAVDARAHAPGDGPLPRLPRRDEWQEVVAHTRWA